jgi:hypothetical protein
VIQLSPDPIRIERLERYSSLSFLSPLTRDFLFARETSHQIQHLLFHLE